MSDPSHEGTSGRIRTICTALIVILVTGCGEDPIGMPEGPTIVGTWTLNQSALSIDSEGGVLASIDGTVGLASPDVVSSYFTDGATFSIADETGPQSCDLGVVGRYTYQVEATSLSFELLGDGCTGRSGFLTAGVWSRD